jgi:hypothetical protein
MFLLGGTVSLDWHGMGNTGGILVGVLLFYVYGWVGGVMGIGCRWR